MQSEKQKITPKQALLMEDSKVHQKFMHVFLQQLNYEVDLAEDGQKALKMTRDKLYDLILADIRIKGLSGDKVIPLIRRKNTNKNAGTLIIVWSVFVNKNNENEEEFLDWGADGVLTKDCKLEGLKTVIDECSELPPYQRKFLRRIKMIDREWKETGGQRESLKDLSNLNKNQLSILFDAVITIMEYKQWDDLSQLAVKTSHVITETFNA